MTKAIENGKAVAYCRVSKTELSSGGVSLEAQEARIRAYCASTGLELVEVIHEDGISGSVALEKRPAGSRLVGLRKNGLAHVIVTRLDRAFRSASDALGQTAAWDKSGIAFHVVDLGGAAFNSSSSFGRFFLNVLAGVAELERAMIAERTRTALNFKRTHLQPYGAVPLGFKRIGDRLEADPAELEIVAKIRAERAAGKSFAKIAAALNAAGTPTKTGRRWHASTVRYLCMNDGLYQGVPGGNPSGNEEVRS